VLSVAAQGITIDKVAKWLGVLDPNPNPPKSSFYFDPTVSPDKRLLEFEVAPNSKAENKRIVDFRLPAGVLVLLIARAGKDVVPNGGTVLRRGDLIQVLADSDFATHGSDIFKKLPSAQI
jgi:NhaP-type Na+/H+ and K+/H+ antiporter